MHHTMMERVAALAAIAGAFGLGYCFKGFEELNATIGMVGCTVSVALFAWMVWDMLDV